MASSSNGGDIVGSVTSQDWSRKRVDSGVDQRIFGDGMGLRVKKTLFRCKMHQNNAVFKGRKTKFF